MGRHSLWMSKVALQVSLILFVGGVTFGGVVVGSVAAYAATTPGKLPGFEGGAELVGRGVRYSSPVIAEIDGDTEDGKEIAVSTPDGILNVMKSDGTLLWSARLPNADCSEASSSNKAYGAPAVGALFGDGVQYVVAPYGGLGSRSCDGGVIAYRGSDGAVKWKFSTQAWAKKNKYGSSMFGVFGTPALADVDGNGKLEIGFGSFDRNVYLLEANGSVRWFYNAADTVWGSPTFANVDSDSNLEMIIATDISKNDRLVPPTKNGGFLYAFKTKKLPTRSKRLGFRNPKAFVWMTYLDQSLYSSPVVADVLPSNPGDEVVIESGCYFKRPSGKQYGDWIKVLDLKTGKVLKTLNAIACSPSSPSVADIDGDGQLEIVATTSGAKGLGGDGFSRVSAWKADNPDPIWSVVPYGTSSNDANGGHFLSPVIADLDGNGSLEVAVSNNGGVAILAAATGEQLSCPNSSCSGMGPFSQGAATNNTPAIGDVNNDGKLDLVAAGGSAATGKIYAWTNFSDSLGSDPGPDAANLTPWAMWRKNPARAAR